MGVFVCVCVCDFVHFSVLFFFKFFLRKISTVQVTLILFLTDNTPFYVASFQHFLLLVPTHSHAFNPRITLFTKVTCSKIQIKQTRRLALAMFVLIGVVELLVLCCSSYYIWNLGGTFERARKKCERVFNWNLQLKGKLELVFIFPFSVATAHQPDCVGVT